MASHVSTRPIPSDRRLAAIEDRLHQEYAAARARSVLLSRSRPIDDLEREDAVWDAVDARRWYYIAKRRREDAKTRRDANRKGGKGR